MKKPKSPAFQFYATEFLGSDAVAVMSAEAIGVYVILLARDWKHGGLPDDHAKLARWGKVTPRKFAKLWPTIAPEFELREDGRLYNPRLEDERGKQAAWRAKSSAGGQQGSRKRWGKPDKGGHRVVTPNDDSLSSSSSSKPPTPLAPEGAGVRGKEPTALADVVPRALPPEASEAWRKMLTGEKPVPPRGVS